MTRTFVAIDLETTGLDPERDRITEIGAVRFNEDGEEVETFETLVNPGREIPFFIERLTGITNGAVRTAPKLPEVADDLRGFVGSSVVVGQNVGFDLGYLRREGVVFGGGVADTAVLSRMLLPARQGRGLMDLAASLGVEAGEHHRALPDARTTAAVFVALLRRAREIPAEQRRQLARLISMNDLVLAELIAGDEWGTPAATTERMLPVVRPVPSMPQLVKREQRVALGPQDVRAIFAAGSRIIDQFEERHEQVQMAEAVRKAFAGGGHWLIEAGTGVGKSLAYLIPAALNAIRNGERVVISTNTINLQEQLLRKDVPSLRQMLVASGAMSEEGELRATLLKGRANYLCMQRFVASYAAGLGDPDFAHLGAAMLLWLPETESGDRAELSLDQADWATWQRFSAQDTDCLSRQNRFVREGQCFLMRARKAAESAHLVIVNHALLLADIASNGNALPPYDHLIVDEAHNLEDQATQQFGATVSRRRVIEALDGLHRRASRDQREGGVATVLRGFPEGGVTMAGKALEAAAAGALTMLGPCFEALGRQTPGSGDDDRLLVTRGVRAQPAWSDVESAWDGLDRALKQVNEAALAAARIVAETALVEEPDAIAGEVQSAAWKLEELRLKHAELMSAHDDDTIVWISREPDTTGTLNAAPLDVGPTLWENLFSQKTTVIATSATLSAGGSMDYTSRRLGLEAPQVLQLGSPFDYERATLLAAFTDVPEPNDRGYLQAVARTITQLVLASQGRALALFTSHAAIREVASFIRPELEGAGIVVLAQGLDGSPRQLTENLLANPRTVLLGTASFWEGVDIRGDALSMLIIARLPFAVPTDPVHRARSEQYDNPFAQYSLPGAILKFRQGFGRLIRDRNDRGVVAVLDRRIYEKQYGRDFVSALPRCTQIRAHTETVAAKAREWLNP